MTTPTFSFEKPIPLFSKYVISLKIQCTCPSDMLVTQLWPMECHISLAGYGPWMDCFTFLGLFLEEFKNSLGMLLKQLATDWEDLNESEGKR